MSAYNFSLDRRSLTTVVAGLSAVGVLLFFTGVLVGVGTRPSAATAVPAAPEGPGALAAALPDGDPYADAVREAPDPRTAPDGSREESGTGGPGDEEPLYAVQVGDFPRETPALELLERMGRRGYDAYLVSEYDDDWRLRMQVRFGTWDDEDEARLAADEVAAREGIAATVVSAEELAP